MAEEITEIRAWLESAANKVGGPIRLAAAIKTHKNTVYGWLSGPSEPKASQVKAIMQATGVPAPWSDLNEDSGFSVNSAEPSVLLNSADLVLVPKLDVRVSAGPGALVEAEPLDGEIAFRRDLIRELGVSAPAALRVLTAAGDSMEPVIRPGDLLLVDTGIAAVIHEGIYVVLYDGAVMVKRLAMDPKGVIWLLSENPRVPAMSIAREDRHQVHIAGRVVRVIRAL